MRRFRLLAILLTMSPLVAAAGPNRWTTSGPDHPLISSIVTDPADPDVAYALTQGAGIFKTSDGGAEWIPANDGLPFSFTFVLLIRRDDPAILYAAAGQRLFRSIDGGQHWTPYSTLNSRLPVVINALTFDPATKTLLAGTSHGVFRTADDGGSWSASLQGEQVVAIDALNNGHLFVVAMDGNSGIERLWTSADGGRTWDFIVTTFRPHLMAVDRSNDHIFFGSPPVKGQSNIVLSVDEGKTWTTLPAAPATPNAIVPVPGGLYISTGRGVFQYSDRLQTWTAVADAASVQALAVSADVRRLYASPRTGILTYGIGDARWREANLGLPGILSADVALVPTQPSTAYAATEDGIFRTDDAAVSWKKIDTGSSSHVDVNPQSADTAYAATRGRIEKTDDGGLNWRTVAFSLNPSALKVAPSNPAVVYAALSTAMSKSTDGGETWNPIASGIPMNYYFFYYGFYVTGIAVDPEDSASVCIADPDGILRTVDGGANWASISDMSRVSAVALDHDAVLAASNAGGVIVTTSNGQTWDVAGLIDKKITALTFSTSQPRRLYAGSEDGHLYWSSDRGEVWNALDDGLALATISKIAVDPSGLRLYAATTAGVYEYRIVDDARVERLADAAGRVPQLLAGDVGNAIVIPVAGSAGSADGTLYTTELTLTNGADAPQDALVAFLPSGGSEVSLFRVSLPASSSSAISDFGSRFGIRGIGSLVVIPSGSQPIRAAARIATHPADRRAPFSQSIAAVTSVVGHVRGEVAGLRHDAGFRTNVGIVNLSTAQHQFTVQIDGERLSGQMTVAIPPLALAQVPLPRGDYGRLSLTLFSDTESRWVFYGSTVNRATGEAYTVVGTPSEP